MIDILVVSHASVTAINRLPWRRLADMGWAIEVVTAEKLEMRDISRPADPPSPGDPPLHLLPIRGSNMRLWRYEGLQRLLEQRRPRILMLDYDPGTLIAIECGRWARRNGAHLACLSYDNIIRSVPQEIRQSVGAGARALGARVLSGVARSKVDHVFVLSADSENVMRKFGFEGRTSRIPLGFDPGIFHPDPSARVRLRGELGLRDVTFAYFGRLVPEKGAHLLIAALDRIRDRPWHLLMDRFSDYRHPYIAELSAAIEKRGLTDRVVYFDANHHEIAGYMNAADVVVMPSVETPRWKEQYGRVAAEAMACGRLVIVSDSGSLPELVGDAGVVVPQRDLPSLHEVLERVLDEPELRQRLGSAAASRALHSLSMPVQCRLMHEQFSRWDRPSGPSGNRAQ